MIHHVAMQHRLPREIEEAGAEGETSLPRHDDCVVPERLGYRLAVDRRHLKRVGVDVEDVIAGVFVDYGPLFDGTEADGLIHPIGIEPAAIDQIGKLLVRGCRGNFRFDGAKRESPGPGNLVVVDRRERRFG